MKARKKILRIRVNDEENRKIFKHVHKIESDVSKYLRELAMNDIKQNSPEL